MSYVPAGVGKQAIEHLRTQPPKTELSSAELAEAIGADITTLAAFLRHPTDRGWLSCRKEGRLCYWRLGRLSLAAAPVAAPVPPPDPLPVRQTVVPQSAWCSPQPAPPAPPVVCQAPASAVIPCARGVRLTIAGGRGLLIRDGAVFHLTEFQTAKALELLDALEPAT